jgi:hypothetical protein
MSARFPVAALVIAVGAILPSTYTPAAPSARTAGADSSPFGDQGESRAAEPVSDPRRSSRGRADPSTTAVLGVRDP